MLDALAAASVADLAVYPMNPAGLDLPTDRMIEGFTRQVDIGSEGGTRGAGGREIAQDDLSNVVTQFMQTKNHLRDMAALTGGVSLIDSNDLAGAVDRVLRDASDYYVIAYEPDKEVKGTKVRPIEVRVSRPGVRVLTRKGYMPPPSNPDAEKIPSNLSPTMRTLLAGSVPMDALPMIVQMIAIGEHKGKVRFAVVTETAGGPLVDGLDGDRVGIEQAILSINSDGKMANATQKRAELKVGPQQVADARQSRRADDLVHRSPTRAPSDPGGHRARAVGPRRLDVPGRQCRSRQVAEPRSAAHAEPVAQADRLRRPGGEEAAGWRVSVTLNA